MRFVAFDLGNVLVDYRPERTVAALAQSAGLTLERAAPIAERFSKDPKRRYERGEMTPREFFAVVNAEIEGAGGRPLDFPTFAAGWCLALEARPAARAIVERLRRDVPFGLWSNTDPLHFSFMAPRLPFLARARALHLSFLAGAVKPEPAFFEGALRGLGARPEEVAFVDDGEANVAAARALGIDAFLAATPPDLERGLAERGLLEK